MTDTDETIPRKPGGLPIRQLRVDVITGPEAGRHATSGDEVITVGTAHGNTLQLSDPSVSRYHLEIVRDGAQIRVADLGSTNSTVIGPVRLHESVATVEPGTALSLGDTQIRVTDGDLVMVETPPSVDLGLVKSRSDAMRPLLEMLPNVARSEAPVLLLGESGTGKELAARTIHEHSERAAGPFVTVDCAAITAPLFTSALFGHERGAFTGAAQRALGAFERANGGTLFLDEVGELPLEHQGALLGALERRRVQRVGGHAEIPVDVRVISATHRDLRAEVNRSTFRLDLYYRIAVVLMRIPPLRARSEDIPDLISQFLREEGYEEPVEALFDRQSLKAMRAHRWPGNVRELRNHVMAALAIGQPPLLDPAMLDVPVGDDGLSEAALHMRYKDARRLVTDAFERRYLTHALSAAGGSIRQAAREVGLDRGYLAQLLKKHGIR